VASSFKDAHDVDEDSEKVYLIDTNLAKTTRFVS